MKGLHGILVFGAAVDHDSTPGLPLARRLRQALAEAKADPRAFVIVSGGTVRGRPAEAPIMRDWLVVEGVESARIVLESEATSTYENAMHCANLVALRGFDRVTLVSERYHLLRSRLLLKRALAARGVNVELRVSAAPDGLGRMELAGRLCVEIWKLVKDIGKGGP